MQNRVGKNSSAASAQAKPSVITPQEWKRVKEPVRAAARVKLTVELYLSPLQHRALLLTCAQTHTTPEEVIASATVDCLESQNSDGWNTYKFGVVAGVLDQRPEREKELGDFCGALEQCFKADRLADRISRDMERKAGAL
jgi:hypothetical protein